MNKLIVAAQNFIKKVDEGKARSKHSYNEFKEALKELEPDKEGWVTIKVLPGSWIIAPGEVTPKDYEEVLTDHKRLVRELDVIINGEEGAAKQASLCDIVSQMKDYVEQNKKTVNRINNVLRGAMSIIEKLRPRNKSLYSALKELIRLKEMKYTWGETPEYLEAKPKAWANAKEVLNAKFNPSSYLFPNWTPISEPPKGDKPSRMILVRRSSDEILMGRCINGRWMVYFNDTRGAQSETKELQHDPVVDWQELPITQQQFELNNLNQN